MSTLTLPVNPLLAQLMHQPFPQVAAILRGAADEITVAWDAAVRLAMPQMKHLTFKELKDSTPEILLAIADALASDDPQVIGELVNCAPRQGRSRFFLKFGVAEIMQEDRLLRSIIVQHVEGGLGHQMDELQSAALHAAIDIMLQRSVIALVEEQKLQLRANAETELKFISFLAHDLNNNLNNVTLLLSDHANELRQAGGFSEAVKSLGRAQQSIEDTVTGMRRMLDHERLRKSTKAPERSPVDLHAVIALVACQFTRQAYDKYTKFIIDVRPGTVIESDGELIALVLQNLLGNAVKYGGGGTVRVSFSEMGNFSELCVSDEGPGIAADKLEHIFDAFHRGETHGQHGLGLGLAIATQAATLLGATLKVESRIGIGSTFRLCLPAAVSTEGGEAWPLLGRTDVLSTEKM